MLNSDMFLIVLFLSAATNAITWVSTLFFYLMKRKQVNAFKIGWIIIGVVLSILSSIIGGGISLIGFAFASDSPINAEQLDTAMNIYAVTILISWILLIWAARSWKRV
jgi:hypothetical protein